MDPPQIHCRAPPTPRRRRPNRSIWGRSGRKSRCRFHDLKTLRPHCVPVLSAKAVSRRGFWGPKETPLRCRSTEFELLQFHETGEPTRMGLSTMPRRHAACSRPSALMRNWRRFDAATGEVGQAEKLVRQVLARDPRRPAAQLELGWIAYKAATSVLPRTACARPSPSNRTTPNFTTSSDMC